MQRSEGLQATISLTLPAWIDAMRDEQARGLMPTCDERMALAINVARRNVAENTGGPFGAAVFALPDYTLVALGANLVVATGCSVMHAEIVAIVDAQRRLGVHRLDATGSKFELVTSAEPCAMCMGAVQWAGIGELVCGATDADVRAIGFDEGVKPAAWQRDFASRGITVREHVLRAAACAVLSEYTARSGPLY